MASDRRAGRPARRFGRRGLHVDRACAGNAHRSYRCAQNPDRRVRAQRFRHLAVRRFRFRPLVRCVLQRDRRRRVCRRLHAGAQGADRPPDGRGLLPRDHALHFQLFIRGGPVVSGFPACRGGMGLAGRFPRDGHRPTCDAVRLPAVETGQAEARGRPTAGFRAGIPEYPGYGLRARLWRALLRALWNPNLDGRILDVCRREGFQPARC